MLVMPELAVALRRELAETLRRFADEAVTLSTWSKARASKAHGYVRTLQEALERPLEVVLWQRGAWAEATAARDRIGGELAADSDIERRGQLWLFESVALTPVVKKRFALPSDSRVLGRVLLPLGPPEVERYPGQGVNAEGRAVPGMGLGYLFRTPPVSRARDGIPFLRLLPDLYPGDFLADPHVNFVAARRYLQRCGYDVTPPMLARHADEGAIRMVGLPLAG